MTIQPIGMYGETSRVKVGDFEICRQTDKSIWIEHEDGEGGEFSEAEFANAIKKFFNLHF